MEKTDPQMPAVLKVLRGDFFCMPFGGNTAPWHGERHPVHGETANERWRMESAAPEHLHLGLDVSVRRGRVDKFISLRPGHTAVYQCHLISGMSGPMNLGHHAMLKFPDRPGSGRISTSPFIEGHVAPFPVEDPASGGYSCLQHGARFRSLKKVPLLAGGHTDLTSYPARAGFEDIVMLVSDPRQPFAWTAATFPEEGYAWFALKDPRVLRQTVFWMSNRGRHYPPWNGRHSGVLGLEEVTSYFHYGLAESAAPNPLSKRGVPTCHRFRRGEALAVKYIMAMAAVPRGFDRVRDILPAKNGESVCLVASSGKTVHVPLDLGFLQNGERIRP
jgi:hypothetical protein